MISLEYLSRSQIAKGGNKFIFSCIILNFTLVSYSHQFLFCYAHAKKSFAQNQEWFTPSVVLLLHSMASVDEENKIRSLWHDRSFPGKSFFVLKIWLTCIFHRKFLGNSYLPKESRKGRNYRQPKKAQKYTGIYSGLR